MIIKEAGIVKLIEFKTKVARERYIDNLVLRGMGFCVISEGYTSANGGRYFLKIVESDGKHKLGRGSVRE